MMPVIRVPDDVFRRLQRIATPLVDTPASVIERLLDFHESSQSSNTPLPAGESQVEEAGDLAADPRAASFETYENRNRPHVTIHRADCSQLRKRGGVHRHGQGGYRAHATLAEAESYAQATALPIWYCKYCTPERSK